MTSEYINAESNLKQLNKQLSANQNVLTALKKDTGETTGAYALLNQRYSEAAIKAKDMAAAYGVNNVRTIEAQKEAKALSDQLKEIDKSIGQNQRSVGDYGIALQGLPGIFGEMASKGEAVLVTLRTKFESVKDATMQYKEALIVKKEAEAAAAEAAEVAAAKEAELAAATEAGTATDEMATEAEAARAAATEAATVATEASSGAMKLFKVALASTGIGAIVVLLGSLVAYFTQTNEGSKFLSKSLAVMGAIFKELAGFIAKTVQGVIDFASGIKSFPDLMTKIGKAIEENLLNRFKSFGEVFHAIGELLHGEFSKGMKDLANGMLQLGTGVEDVIGKTTEKAKQLGDAITDVSKSEAKIKDMQRALEIAETQSVTTLAALEAKAAEYKVILGKAGQSLSAKEREDAINGLIKNEDEQLKIKLDLATRKAAIAKASLDLEQKQTGDAMMATRKTYADALAELIKIRGEYNVTITTAQAKKDKLFLQLLTDQITAEKNAAEQSKLILDDKLKNEKLSLDEKLSIIEKIKQADDLNYEQQKQSFQEYVDSTTKGTKKIIDFNELMQISDGKVLQARLTELGLSTQAQALFLTLINDRKKAVIVSNQEEMKVIKEKVDLEISNMQAEIELNNLKNKEIRAGRQATFAEELSDLDENYDNEQKQLDLKHENDLISEEEYLKAQKLLDQKYATDKALTEAQNMQMSLEAEKLHIDNELSVKGISIDKELQLTYDQIENERVAKINAAKGNAEMIEAINEEAHNRDVKAWQDAQQKKQQAFMDFANAAMDVAGKMNDFLKALSDGELQKDTENRDAQKANLDKQLASGLISKDRYDKLVAQGDKELADKKAKLEHEAAVRNKELSAIGVVISTAGAIMKSFQELGPVAGVPGAIFAGLTGALELATILATPIPGGGGGGGIVGGSVPSVPSSVTGSLVARTSGETQQTATTTAMNTALKANPVQQVLVIDDVTSSISNKVQVKQTNSL
jgi:hypothetical protein